MSEIKKVKSPITNDWLTKDKVYDVFNVESHKNYGATFNIIDDEGTEIFCLLKECAFLKCKDWIVVE
jgi:hypothetical protein